MNVEVREQLGTAERAFRAGDFGGARDGFLGAGTLAAGYQLWKTTTRCYRHALELDLLDREVIARLVGLVGRGGHAVEWLGLEHAVPPRSIGVSLAGKKPVVLDELGEWHG